MTNIHRTPLHRGRPQRIACIDRTKKLPLDVPFGKLTAALQKCYDRHFLPVWGFPVKLYNTKKAKKGEWQIQYVDTADDASTDGYHDLTKNGAPIAYVFMNSVLESREPVSLTASHELFEMAIDPIANMWAEAKAGWEYSYEMCDPVEEDTFLVDGMEMSNFVYPAWFEPFKHPRKTKFDHLGLLKAPFTARKTGYVIYKRGGRYKEHWGSAAKKKRFLAEDRRGHRSEYRNPKGQRLRVERPRSNG